MSSSDGDNTADDPGRRDEKLSFREYVPVETIEHFSAVSLEAAGETSPPPSQFETLNLIEAFGMLGGSLIRFKAVVVLRTPQRPGRKMRTGSLEPTSEPVPNFRNDPIPVPKQCARFSDSRARYSTKTSQTTLAPYDDGIFSCSTRAGQTSMLTSLSLPNDPKASQAPLRRPSANFRPILPRLPISSLRSPRSIAGTTSESPFTCTTDMEAIAIGAIAARRPTACARRPGVSWKGFFDRRNRQEFQRDTDGIKS